jgi:hypothetical protein
MVMGSAEWRWRRGCGEARGGETRRGEEKADADGGDGGDSTNNAMNDAAAAMDGDGIFRVNTGVGAGGTIIFVLFR